MCADIADIDANVNIDDELESFYKDPSQWPKPRLHKTSMKRERSEHAFEIESPFEPTGDQPRAIKELTNGLKNQARDQVLLGVTGSGKTFTMAHVIANMGRPALIIAHNKTLAAQLYTEFKAFFPNNAVEYFVSYYDYYQPESYVPRSDMYIAKESSINEDLDRMRHAATRALFERNDCIIVSSVSCIYGIGAPETYARMVLDLKAGQTISLNTLARELAKLQYIRNDINFKRGTFRMRGDIVDIFPVHYENRGWRLSFFGENIEDIWEIDATTGKKITTLQRVCIYPKSHYVTPGPTLQQASGDIKKDLNRRLKVLYAQEKLVEAQRLEERTRYDLETLAATGLCHGIENYSRYLTTREPGEPPPTLFEYLPDDALLFIDESHATLPQLRAMFRGDLQRKTTLARYGFRLPSCIDNRPLRFEEWDEIRPRTIYVSATPGEWELTRTQGVFVEQVIRPTGLLEPPCVIRPIANQVDDLMLEARATIQSGWRVLVTTLTKTMAEQLSDYLRENGLKVRYMHSDIETLERVQILEDLRMGVFDILVGINLLREGLDVPECALVAILDADKEGFLRSRTSLVQTIGRAARNIESRVILYADVETASIRSALSEIDRRREKQIEYNRENNIIPRNAEKSGKGVGFYFQEQTKNSHAGEGKKRKSDKKERRGREAPQETFTIAQLEEKMKKAAQDLDFETAADLRDLIQKRLDIGR